MSTIDDILKEPETFKEKLLDLWDDLTRYYPKRIREFWWDIQRFFRNTWRYRQILVKDNDFDHGYLDGILLQKLEFMADYFRTARIVEGEEDTYHQINLTLRLGKIAFEEIHFQDGRYCNTRNFQRFIPTKKDEWTEKDNEFLKDELVRRKAKCLFWKMMDKYEATWWD